MSKWYVHQAKVNPDLFRVIFDFNRRPQSWLHPEVMSALPHRHLVQALSQTNHGASHLSGWLGRELKLDSAETHWDFEEPRRRIALLSATTLHRLSCYAGSAACWPKIAAAIQRDELREVKATLGEEAHVFALRRGRLIVPEEETLSPPSGLSLAQHAMKVGWQIVSAVVENDPATVQQRFALKLPPKVAETLASEGSGLSPEFKSKAWQTLRKISNEVLTEGEAKCFA